MDQTCRDQRLRLSAEGKRDRRLYGKGSGPVALHRLGKTGNRVVTGAEWSDLSQAPEQPWLLLVD